MTKIIKSFYEKEHSLDSAAECFFFHHPYLGYFTAFIGIPIFTLGAVTIGATVIILPLSFLFGWI